MALSRGSPRVGVTHHPALWSPDFPQLALRSPGRLVRLKGSGGGRRPSRPPPPTRVRPRSQLTPPEFRQQALHSAARTDRWDGWDGGAGRHHRRNLGQRVVCRARQPAGTAASTHTTQQARQHPTARGAARRARRRPTGSAHQRASGGFRPSVRVRPQVQLPPPEFRQQGLRSVARTDAWGGWETWDGRGGAVGGNFSHRIVATARLPPQDDAPVTPSADLWQPVPVPFAPERNSRYRNSGSRSCTRQRERIGGTGRQHERRGGWPGGGTDGVSEGGLSERLSRGRGTPPCRRAGRRPRGSRTRSRRAPGRRP